MSSCVDPGVLLQHARDRSFSISFFHSRPRYVHPVTLQLVADVLHVPRIEFPNYPSCKRLRTVSRDDDANHVMKNKEFLLFSFSYLN